MYFIEIGKYYLKIQCSIPFRAFCNVVWRPMGQDLVFICLFLCIVDTISPCIKLDLEPWDKKPSKREAKGWWIESSQKKINNWNTIKLLTHTSIGQAMSYHPLITPISRRISNPGVNRCQSWDHEISGIIFFLCRIQRCWTEPLSRWLFHCCNMLWALAMP